MSEPPQPSADAASVSDAERSCYCPAGDVIDPLGRRYAIQVVCAVGTFQPARYTAIADAFADVSSSTLSTRLEELTDAGSFSRTRHDAIPPRVEYELTDDGEEPCDLLEPLVRWADGRTTE